MITKADKKRIIANLEALLEAHREAGNMDQAVAIFARILPTPQPSPPGGLARR